MSEPISRRQFLRNTTVAGGAVVALPGLAFSADPAAASGRRPERTGRPKKRELSSGPYALVLDDDSGPISWSRLGGDITMELGSAAVLVGVPTVVEQEPVSVTIDEFERGLGHRQIIRDLGEPALARLRDEVAYRAVLV